MRDSLIEVEVATVYRVGRRRFLSKKAAWTAVARARVHSRCDCDPGDAVTPGLACHYHADPEHLARLLTRYARILRRAHRREARNG